VAERGSLRVLQQSHQLLSISFPFVIIHREFSNGLYLCLAVAVLFSVALLVRIVCQQYYLETGNARALSLQFSG
jgi:hypothetical protein